MQMFLSCHASCLLVLEGSKRLHRLDSTLQAEHTCVAARVCFHCLIVCNGSVSACLVLSSVVTTAIILTRPSVGHVLCCVVHCTQRWVSSRPMFLAFAPEMLDDWLRRANREAAAAAAAAGVEEGDSGLTDPDDTVTRQGRVLARLYREMHASAKEEFAAAQQVFPKPTMALEMFLSRLLEQNVQAVLERLLLPSSIGMATLAAVAAQQHLPPHGPPAGVATAAMQANSPGAAGGAPQGHNRTNSFMERATNLATSFAGASAAAAVAASSAIGNAAAAGATGGQSASTSAAGAAAAAVPQTVQSAGLQRQQLRLLVEAYGKTQRLASNLEKSVKGIAQLDVISMAEGLWPNFLGNYPEQELQWLQAACAEEVSLDCLRAGILLLQHSRHSTALSPGLCRRIVTTIALSAGSNAHPHELYWLHQILTVMAMHVVSISLPSLNIARCPELHLNMLYCFAMASATNAGGSA